MIQSVSLQSAVHMGIVRNLSEEKKYSYANCDLYVEKAIEDCGNNTLRKEFLRAKGWDAPDDFDINDEEE